MSDTETVVIKRNSKPLEGARQKLKEKRERLKREKEEKLIEEAKQRLANENEMKMQKKKQEDEEKVKQIENDPMEKMYRRMEEIMNKLNKPESVIEQPIQKVKAPRKKKVEVVYAEEPKEIPKPKVQRKKKVQITEVTESPSNVFVGDDVPPQQQEVQYVSGIPLPPTHPLLAALSSRRMMNSWE
jgi:hypothetical protein